MISGRSSDTTYDATLNLKPGNDLLGHRRPAEDVAPLEDDDPQAGAREIRGAGQAVMTAADDHGVVRGPLSLLPRRNSSDASTSLLWPALDCGRCRTR